MAGWHSREPVADLSDVLRATTWTAIFGLLTPDVVDAAQWTAWRRDRHSGDQPGRHAADPGGTNWLVGPGCAAAIHAGAGVNWALHRCRRHPARPGLRGHY